jgi:hypothetical protein
VVGFRLENGGIRSASLGMDGRTLAKIIGFLVVVWAAMIALTLGFVAYYLLAF